MLPGGPADCFYSGFTSKCVDAAQAAPPAPEGASVQVLVNLNVRAEARDDAEVVGVVPSQTCVTTELCLTATDGAWCCAKFGERTGWMRKLAVRQNRWAIVTFDNSCPSRAARFSVQLTPDPITRVSRNGNI
jgi:hypothetical protein